MPNELYHHGILGMKWGVRRFQNADGSLTAAGKKRYSVDKESAKKALDDAKRNYKEAKKAYNKATVYGMGVDEKAAKQVYIADNEKRLAKRDLASEKAKERLNDETKAPSKRRLAYQEEYKKRGMTDEEAEIEAYKRERTEKILLSIGAVAATAAVAYAGYKMYDKYVDKLIPKDMLLQRITADNSMGVPDAFYASFTKGDKAKYAGMYAKEVEQRIGGGDVFNKTISLKDGLKIASPKNSERIFSDLIKNDPNYAEELKNILRPYAIGPTAGLTKQGQTLQKAYYDLKAGKTGKSVYEGLNLVLPLDQTKNFGLAEKFYDRLRSAGYDGILDVNDRRAHFLGGGKSGYQSANPIIVINSGKAVVDSVSRMTTEEINKNYSKAAVDVSLRAIGGIVLKDAAIVGAATAAKAGLKAKQDDKIVQEYRKEHPDTKLSYTEILKNERHSGK